MAKSYTSFVTGEKELDANLKALGGPAAQRITIAALRAGMKKLAAVQRTMAPRGKTGNLQNSIGSRVITRGGKIRGKAGVNVGRKSVGINVATGSRVWNRAGGNHAHLVALGTRRRYRKTLGGKFKVMGPVQQQKLTTGVMPKNDFIRRSDAASRSEVLQIMRDRIAQGIATTVNRIGRKTGRAVEGIV